MSRAAPPASPCVPGTLCVALLLLLGATCRGAADTWAVSGTRAHGLPTPAVAPVASELRCQCLETTQGIHARNIQSVSVAAPGPHCPRTEVIVTLKNGQQVCLNPEAPLVKKIIQKMLKKDVSS